MNSLDIPKKKLKFRTLQANSTNVEARLFFTLYTSIKGPLGTYKLWSRLKNVFVNEVIFEIERELL